MGIDIFKRFSLKIEMDCNNDFGFLFQDFIDFNEDKLIVESLNEFYFCDYQLEKKLLYFFQSFNHW